MSLDKNKTDSSLGLEVKKHLIEKEVETPILKDTKEVDVDKIQEHFAEIMNLLNLDLSDDSLQDTPRRVAKMFTKELFWGLNYNNFPKATVVDNKFKYDEMILEKNITSMSVCEHHFVTIDGKAHVAYIPNEKVLGLSKLNRIVEFFSRRPQVQERLTEQIYYALSYVLGTENVAVILEAKHYCVKCRGVEDHNTTTITSKLGGVFRDGSVRTELFGLIR